MTTQKTRPRVGDECWFVEWTYEMAFEGEGEYRYVDRDNCKTRTRKVATREEAERLAKEVWPQTVDCWGIVEYWPSQFVAYDEDDASLYPHAGFWEATADSEIYEGDC